MGKVSGKKGEASWVLISMIILIVSLAILVLVFIQFNNSVSAQREACRTSVILRGTIPDVDPTGGTNIKDAISLNCYTKKVCVSAFSKGTCSNFGKDFETVKVSGNLEEKKKQILQEVSREMADCWNLMGEGKLAVFSREVSDKGSTYTAAGVICTRIAFDNSITGAENVEKDVAKDITSVPGLNNYFFTHKVPGRNISYWDFFRNAPAGDTLNKIAGSNFVPKDDLDLLNEKSIMYVEFKASEMGRVIGTEVGVAATVIGAIYSKGKSLSFMGGAGNLVGIAAASWVGDEIYKTLLGEMDKESSVSGLFLFDYSRRGFSGLDFNKGDFYLANKV